MKLNKLKKRFWTLNRHNSEGFTLVELIVVIAILAILAGVGVPVYSGYIKRANEAADQQLLSAINTAFASACLQNGVDVHSINSASIELEDSKVDMDSVAPYKEAFAQFYAGNENAGFSVIEYIVFDAALHAFVDGASETISVYYNGAYITISGEDLQNLRNSAFAEIGADKLLTMVGMASGMIDITNSTSTLAQLATSPEATAFLYEKLGVTDMGGIITMMTSKYPQGDMSNDDYNAYLDEKYNQMVANSAVLYAAQNSQAASEGIWDVLKADSVKDTIKSNTNTEEQLAQSAMAFAMYSAYTKTDSLEGIQLTDVYNTLDSAEFKAYLDTPEAKADLDGYLSSMNMINDGASSNSAAAQDILLNGFTDPNLSELISQLVGN